MGFNDRMDPLRLLPDATRSLVRTVDGLPDEAYAEPSLLPGWTRAHVVAHLVLHAEGSVRVLDALSAGATEVSMYASAHARDADIDELAATGPEQLRERLLAATTELVGAVARTPEQAWRGSVRRTPEGEQSYPAVDLPAKRLVEVEVHHVDLGTGYERASWSAELSEHLVDTLSPRLEPHGPLTLRASDLGTSWPVGPEGGPWVSGTAADLAWWLTGRGGGEGLTSETGELPDTGTW